MLSRLEYGDSTPRLGLTLRYRVPSVRTRTNPPHVMKMRVNMVVHFI